MESRTIKKPWWVRPVTCLIWAVAIVVFLAVALLLFTQTRPFKNWARDYAVDSVNETINGKLSIERLDGNFFTNVRLSGISLETDGDTIATVASVGLRYDLWALLSKTIKIDSLVIDSAFVLVEQLPDSTWNLTRLTPDDTLVTEEDTVSTGFAYAVELGALVVKGASANIVAVDSLFPSRVDGIELLLSGSYTSDRQYLSLEAFGFTAHEPNFRVNNITCEIVSDTSQVAVEELMVETALNRITGAAQINLMDFSRSDMSLATEVMELYEFRDFLPTHIAALSPVLDFQARLSNDSLWAEAVVVSGKQRMDLSATVSSFAAIIDSTVRKDINYSVGLGTRDLVMGDWLGDHEIDVLLSGDVTVEGSGIEPAEMTVDARGDFGHGVIQGQLVSRLIFDVNYVCGDVSGRTMAEGAFGEVELDGKVEGVLRTPAYNFDVALSRFDLSKLAVVVDTMPTDINLSGTLVGVGFELDSARGKARLDIAPSKIVDLALDGGVVSLGYSPDGLRIDTMSLASAAVTVDVSGDLSWERAGRLEYNVRLEDASMFSELTEGSLSGGYGEITGVVTGNLENLSTESRFEFFELVLVDITVAEVQGASEVTYRDSVVSGDIRLAASGINANGTVVDSLFVSGQFDNTGFDGTLAAGLEEGLKSEIVISLALDSLIEIVLRSVTVGYADIIWKGGSDSTFVSLGDDDSYTVSNLTLSSVSPDGNQQTVRLDGVVSLTSESSLKASVEDLALKPLASLYDIDAGGTLSIELNLSGTANSPHATGSLSNTEGHYQNYAYHELAGNFDYRDQKASFELDLRPTLSETLAISGSIPFAFTLADTSDAEPFSDTVSVRVKADRLPLDILKVAGYHIEQANGYIFCDLTVSNTLDDPYINGALYIRDGSLKIPNYGINYGNIAADVHFQPKAITLDSLAIQDRKGKLTLSGQMNYDSSLVTGQISASMFNLVADDFFLVNHRHYEMQISSAINLEATGREATYSGDLTVSRSRFYLPAFMELSETDALDEATLPMLVAATLPDSSVAADSIMPAANGATAADSVQSEFMKNLRGSLRVVIPKNTWITSPELRLELAGDIEVVKQGPDFELFGNIRVVRGHYELYGKRFTVKKGELIFQGGSDYVAGLDIEAAHVFRTAAREKKTLLLFVSGTSETPLVKFRLDEAEISEGDAVSYILFGRSLDELTQGQRTTVSDGAESGSMASGVAASLLAGQLSKVIGDRLNLDVIEIKAQGDLQSAAVVIGKYLTPDLFMSYQRSFGSTSGDDLEPETVTLEYQLTRLIYLQLTEGDPEQAGFDVIVKFQKR